MAVSTTSNISGFYNTLYERAMFVLREQNLMAGLVTQLTGQGLAQRKQGIYPQLSAVEVAEGTDFSAQNTWSKSSKMTLTPKIAKAQVVITQSQMDTDEDDTMNDAAEELGGALATKIDTDLVGVFSSFANDAGTAGSALTLKRTAAAMSRLQNAKARAPFYYVLHPYGWYDVWVELGQPTANQAFLGDTANAALRDYAVSKFNNATWVTSSNISVDASDDAVSSLFTRDAIALDTRKSPEMFVEEDPSIAGYGYEINMEAWYAVGTRRDEHGIKLTHDATTPTGV